MASVVGASEVLLNSERYKISGPVRKTLVSIAAPRFTIGDTQRGADPRASILTQNDFRGGIGWNRGLDSGSADRAWWTTCQTRFKGHLLLPRKPNVVTANTGSGTIDSIIEFTVGASTEIYTVNSDNKVYKYNNASDAWSSPLKTLTDPTGEAIIFRDTTASYMIFARGESGYTFTTDASTFTDMSVSAGAVRNVEYFAIWHGQLWGIDNEGVLKQWASGPAANPTEKGALPLPDGYVTSLFVYRDASGSPIIYAGTKVGLWAFDETNNRWESTELRLPFHERSGSGTVVWRDAVYFPAGNAIYKYQTGSNTAVVSLVGFDRDHGIPKAYAGQIIKLIGTHNDLLAFVNADTSVSYSVFATGRQASGFGGSSAVVSGTGASSVLGFNDTAWEVKWVGGVNIGLTTGHVGFAYNEYRMWYAIGSDLYWIELSPDVINPEQTTGFEYDTGGGTLETPWFDGGDAAGNKTAISLRAITSSCSANITVQLSYAVDFTESYTSLGTITTNGTTTYDFASGVGVEFSSIKFKATLASNISVSSPDLNLIELRWREKIPPKYGFSITIDAAKSFRGSSPKQILDNITTVINTNTLVPFTYKDNDSDRTYYVDLVAASGFEFTGLDERGQIQVQLVET
tara:strand:- start:1222 stop:3111 length:1890 start_codon:yes stop_codon:yes gene_type:complete